MKNGSKGKKHLNASSLIFIFALLVIFAFSKLGKVKVLTIVNQDTNEKYYSTVVKNFDTLAFNWIHSLEKIPWDEEYSILGNNHLMLKKIYLIAFGAGIPHNKGQVTTVKDGVIVMDEINEEFDEINWIHSQTALKSIKLNDKTIIKGSDLPHHEALKLKIEKGLVPCQK